MSGGTLNVKLLKKPKTSLHYALCSSINEFAEGLGKMCICFRCDVKGRGYEDGLRGQEF